MLPLAISASAVLLTSVLTTGVLAQVDCDTKQYPPLTGKHFTYPSGIPEKVDTDDTCRGPQSGYTICNNSTEGPNSQCQLAMLNNIQDFCLWGPTTPNSTISDTEAATVAWCTKPGHGTRIIPPGTLTGLQVLYAPDYILFAGTLNQQNINIASDDGGGEMDPHGADQRGNPLGSLVYSNAFPSNHGNNNSFQQVIEWNNFMGSDQFCFKICDPSVADSTKYCNNIYDETGCNFNAPAAYTTGVFEVCDSDDMDPVGIYESNGQSFTYSQPSVINTLPSIRTPASSNCKTYASTDLFAAVATNSIASSASTPTGTASSSTGTGKPTVSVSSLSSVTTKPPSSVTSSGSGSNPSTTSAKSGASSTLRTDGGMLFAAGVSVLAVFGGVLVIL